MTSNIRGSGQLGVNGKPYPVSYSITVEDVDGKRRGEGTLSAASRIPLEAAAMTTGCTLRLRSGEMVEVTVSEVEGDGATPRAKITIESAG